MDDEGLEKLAAEVARVKLARYHYKADAEKKPHLGFIIEDRPMSPAVEPDRDRVDLYGYTSMAVAALQVQNKQLQAQQKQLEGMQREIAALRAQQSCAPVRGVKR